jgi:hypothetical protein
MRRQRRTLKGATGIAGAVLGIGCALALPAASSACEAGVETRVEQPTPAQLAAAGLKRLPVAPERRRVDLVAPPFSDSTGVSNPLFPIADLRSAVLNGHVDGKPFRVETTLLPDTRVIEWSPGQCVRTLVSQYVAYSGGRIKETALDFYAQAADGSVWYLGEDVFNYKRGALEDLHGSWLAGKEGPAAMIMPANPRVGDVYRPENIPGLVFEEVTVKEVGRTVRGPSGPVRGAIVVSELHDDGTREEKMFAPGYGEFFTASGGDVEAMAMAVPVGARPGPVPDALRRIRGGANRIFGAAAARRWRLAETEAGRMTRAWRTYRGRGAPPPRLVAPMDRALAALRRAVEDNRARAARHAALDVAQAALDLELRYRPVAAIDQARFDLWARRVRLDAAAGHRRAVGGDVATLEWIRDRFARDLDGAGLVRVDRLLNELRGNVADGEPRRASRNAAALRRALSAARRKYRR